MTDILALLQPIHSHIRKITLRQMSRVIAAMLAMTGRVTMLGISPWAERGGSYRTIQRFFRTVIPWGQAFWTFSLHIYWIGKTPKYLKQTQSVDGFETRIYQMQLLLREFDEPLNVVILLRINLTTHAWADVILFSSDLNLAYNKLIDYYSLRFQIEFNFRDARQFWGLEDFMNVSATAVTNAANLSLFMVVISSVLMCKYRLDDPNFSILDLKSHY